MQKVVRGLGHDIVEELECDPAGRLGVDGDVEEDAGVGHVCGGVMDGYVVDGQGPADYMVDEV
jgi:hypothetical protein